MWCGDGDGDGVNGIRVQIGLVQGGVGMVVLMVFVLIDVIPCSGGGGGGVVMVLMVPVRAGWWGCVV
jgi:hypothetical protein